ncbi:MAG TPA: acyl-CoA dehydrogenase family protein, partial [Myxococcota bacterium]
MARAEATESPENAEFRREVRAWIEANKPPDPGFKLPQSFLEVESERQFEFLREWQRKVYEAGYLGLDWPVEYGGRGDPHKRQRIVSQELARAGAPFMVNTIGLQWAGPTILAYGTEEQKRRYLKPILSCEEIWCQGFSEPGAGSDLASLQTTATRTDDGWVVTGHKVWTTLAHFAKWMILLARTDPSAPKYAGISYFLFPMDAPGVTVQPLIKMTGEGGFNQVIFDKAPMPKSALLGQLGQGWQIAMTTLTFERGAAEGSGAGTTTPT